MRVAETRPWLIKAVEDLRAAKHEFTAAPPLLSDIVFHCQQAAEKAMKGFLTWHNVPFRKTHSLEEVGEQCLETDPTLRPLVDRAVPLTDYAWRFRYPGDPEEPSVGEAEEEAFAIAREVCRHPGPFGRGGSTMIGLLGGRLPANPPAPADCA